MSTHEAVRSYKSETVSQMIEMEEGPRLNVPVSKTSGLLLLIEPIVDRLSC